MATSNTSVAGVVRRSAESWNFIYIFLGFALAIEGTVIQMLPLTFPVNVSAFLVVGAFTFWLFLFNGHFQNRLIGWKADYENRGWRAP